MQARQILNKLISCRSSVLNLIWKTTYIVQSTLNFTTNHLTTATVLIGQAKDEVITSLFGNTLPSIIFPQTLHTVTLDSNRAVSVVCWISSGLRNAHVFKVAIFVSKNVVGSVHCSVNDIIRHVCEVSARS